VTLTPRGKVPRQSLQLSIGASSVHDTQGRPLDGNRDGQPGGDFQATFGNAGIRLAGAPRTGPSSAVSAAAFDALLFQGHLSSMRRSR
jgi:hypothetical protein